MFRWRINHSLATIRRMTLQRYLHNNQASTGHRNHPDDEAYHRHCDSSTTIVMNSRPNSTV